MPADLVTIEPFEVDAELLHFAFRDPDESPVEISDALLAHYNDQQLANIEAYFRYDTLEHQTLAHECVNNDLVVDFRQYGPAAEGEPHIKFVVAIRGDEGLSEDEVSGLGDAILDILDRSKKIRQLSLYKGDGFVHFLALGRVDGDDFHEIHSDIVSPLNSPVLRRAYGCITETSLSGQRGMLVAEEGLSTLADYDTSPGLAIPVKLVGYHIDPRRRADPTPPDSGVRVINGRFVVQDQLGSGGSSEVFRVYDRLAEIDRALKLLYSSGEGLAFREIEALQKLNHKGIERHIDSGVVAHGPHRGRLFIVVEYIEGMNLREVLESQPELLTTTTALSITARILDALEYMHPNDRRYGELSARTDLSEAELLEVYELRDWGTIHRDIKPENIIRTVDDQIKLVDFGIASPAHSFTGTRSGTAGYFAPDAGTGSWEPADDMFACGVVLYEMLCRALPYRDANGAEVDVPIDIRERVEVSTGLGAVIMKAVADSREDRYASAWEMRDAIAETAEYEGIH